MFRFVSLVFLLVLLNPSASPSQSENWTALPLSASGLNTTTYVAAVLGTWDQPAYTRQLVRVQWRTGDPIDLYVIRPHGVAKPPAIIYLYDYRFDTERFTDDDWCLRMTANGFAAVGFTPALSPQRFHARPLKEWFVSELQEALGISAHDVQMVVNYLATREDIDMGRIGMFAQGSGGSIALLAASVDSRIAALDVLNPWGDWPDWLKESAQIPDNERPAYIQPAFLDKVSALDPVNSIPRLAIKAVRIVQVMDDPVTPRSAKDKIAAAVRAPSQLVRYEDVKAHSEALNAAGGVAGWLRSQLQPN
jgi:dienelactone hydrolase